MKIVKYVLQWLIVGAIILMVLVSISSCNVAKRSKSKFRQESDSFSVSHETKNDIKKSDSLSENKIDVLKKEESEWDDETVIEYADTVIYVPRKSNIDDSIKIGGDPHFEIYQPIKRVVVKSRGRSSKIDSASYAQKVGESMLEDYSEIKNDTTAVHTEASGSTNNKWTWRFPGYQFVIGIIVLMIVLGLMKKFRIPIPYLNKKDGRSEKGASQDKA